MDRVNVLLTKAADEAFRVSQHTRNSEEVRDMYRQTRAVLLQLRHALEHGPTYKLAGFGEEIDKAVQAREDSLHVNPDHPARY